MLGAAATGVVSVSPTSSRFFVSFKLLQPKYSFIPLCSIISSVRVKMLIYSVLERTFKHKQCKVQNALTLSTKAVTSVVQIIAKWVGLFLCDDYAL